MAVDGNSGMRCVPVDRESSWYTHSGHRSVVIHFKTQHQIEFNTVIYCLCRERSHSPIPFTSTLDSMLQAVTSGSKPSGKRLPQSRTALLSIEILLVFVQTYKALSVSHLSTGPPHSRNSKQSLLGFDKQRLVSWTSFGIPDTKGTEHIQKAHINWNQ